MLTGAHGKQCEQSKVTAPQGRGQATAGGRGMWCKMAALSIFPIESL